MFIAVNVNDDDSRDDDTMLNTGKSTYALCEQWRHWSNYVPCCQLEASFVRQLSILYPLTGTVHYENTPIQIYWKLYNQKKGNFPIKNSDIFHIPAQNIDCGYSLEPPRRGGSNEYPQSMFLSRNKKNNVYPCKLQFYYIKVGFKGVKII